MVTFQEALDRRAGAWCLWLEIAGLGTANGPYRFCTTAPDFAAGAAEWLPILRELPSELTEEVDPLGGVVKAGSLEFTLVDVGDVLTSLFRFDAEPVGELLQVLDATTDTFFVRNGAFAAVDDVYHLGNEAMVCTAVVGAGTPGAITVTRGALGTDAEPHPILTPIRGWIAQLHGRTVRLYLAPRDVDDAAAALEVGEYSILKVGFTADWTGWRLTAGSTVLNLKRTVAPVLQGFYRGTQGIAGRALSLERVNTSRRLIDFNVWPADQGRAYFLLDDQEMVIAVGTGVSGATASGPQLIDQISVRRRAVLGTQAIETELAAAYDRGKGPKVVRPLVASTEDDLGSFRYIPATAADQEDRADPAVVQSDHFVDICLCLMTSSRTPDDGLELVNYEPGQPNWSTLPVGYGAGIRAARIDFAAWSQLKARVPNWRFPRFWLTEPAQLGKLLTEAMLRPLGVFVTTRNGRIRPVLPRLPFEGQAAAALDHSNLLAEPRPFRPPLVSGGYDGDQQKRAILLRPRDPAGNPAPIVITPGDFGGQLGPDQAPTQDDVIDLDLPAVQTNQAGVTAFLEELAARRLFRALKPPLAIEAQADLSVWDLDLGEVAALTFAAAPNARTGARGIVGALLTTLGRALRLDLDAPGWRLTLLGYGGAPDVGRVSAAGRIAAWAGGTLTATLDANRHTDPDGDVLGYPTSDAEAFLDGMVVKLVDADGTDAGGGTQVVQGDGAGNAVVLDGDFGGAAAPGLTLVLADYGDARAADRDRYVAFADTSTRRIAGTRTAWGHGEP